MIIGYLSRHRTFLTPSLVCLVIICDALITGIQTSMEFRIQSVASAAVLVTVIVLDGGLLFRDATMASSPVPKELA